MNERIFNALANGSGTLAHGHTFQAHPTACAAAVAVQKIIQRENILSKVREMGIVLETELREQVDTLPFVGDIRGRGLFWAVEFMANPATKHPFSLASNFSNRIVDTAMEMGLNILGNLGKTGEYDVEFVITSPPYIVTETEIRQIVRMLKEAILSVSREYVLEMQEQERLLNARGERYYRKSRSSVQISSVI